MSASRLFLFGYEDPTDRRVNSAFDADHESSSGVWVIGGSAEEAEHWGQVVAQRYVEWLFEKAGQEPYSWADGQFAGWLEDDPDILAAAENLPTVTLGQFPDFSRVEQA